MAMNNKYRGSGCAEFQQALPDLMESCADVSSHPHWGECETCADLVADLQYIAEQAKLLLPLEAPSPSVWQNIKGTLRREGLMDGEDRDGFVPVKKKLVQARP
jgi:hypothetical protein